MSDLMKNVDERTRLAGTNKLEILLFTLGHDARTGRRETFGINVFKVREVMRKPPITASPDMPAAVKGMVSLRHCSPRGRPTTTSWRTGSAKARLRETRDCIKTV